MSYTLDFDKMLLDLIREEEHLRGKLEAVENMQKYLISMKKPAVTQRARENEPPFDFTIPELEQEFSRVLTPISLESDEVLYE